MRIGTKEEIIQAYTEVACLLKYFPVPYIKKLPNKLLEMIYKNSDEKYIIDIDLKKGLNNQDISDKTKKILAVLTFNYWSNEEQKQNIKKQLYENEKAYQEALSQKYSTENLFKNNKIQNNKK